MADGLEADDWVPVLRGDRTYEATGTQLIAAVLCMTAAMVQLREQSAAAAAAVELALRELFVDVNGRQQMYAPPEMRLEYEGGWSAPRPEGMEP